MARAALVALTWAAAAAAATAARYMDYSGVKMPQYGPGDYESARETAQMGPGAEDYHGHSVDASASLDYKFEEDAHVKSEKPLKETDERESWSKFARRQREFERFHDDETLETLDKYDPEPEAISKEKLNRRSPVHRPRLKNRKSRKNDPLYKRLVKYSHGRSDHIDTDKDYFQVNRDDILPDNVKETEEAAEVYRHSQVTERIIRRKPRDRVMRGRIGDEGDIGEDIEEPNRRMKPDRRAEPEYVLHEEDRQRPTELARMQEPYRPVIGQVDDSGAPSKQKSKTYGNYGDYYDMKRVHNIKNKLPMLLRRTSARVTHPAVSGISTNMIDALSTRRSDVPAAPVPGATALSVVPLPSNVINDTSPSTVKSTPVGVTNTSEEISLAEKSRLSILKKAQRKESSRSNITTLKPPVLLHVTERRVTVVMVEPPSSVGPWMRAREVTNESPERVDRAKRLMRRKLVARARNIQELTDNWDEMICDYIDVSLLDRASRSSPLSVVTTTAALVFLLLAV